MSYTDDGYLSESQIPARGTVGQGLYPRSSDNTPRDSLSQAPEVFMQWGGGELEVLAGGLTNVRRLPRIIGGIERRERT